MATAKKGGLGKGLSALIATSTEVEAPPTTSAPATPQALEDGTLLISIDPRTVRPNPKQPRVHFDEEALQGLADSIRNDGLHEPVVVRKQNDEYELVSGERRVRASVLAELDTIPAVCREVSDDDMLKLGLIENIQREDLNPIETAKAYRALAEHFSWTQDQLAEQVGKKRATVTNTLRLLNLPEEVQDHVSAGDISMGHARALLALNTPTKQSAACERIIKEGLSVREVERLGAAAKPKPPKPTKETAPTARDPHIVNVEDDLRRKLGTQVRLKADPDWKGKIEIDFYNLDDLERILDFFRS